MNGEVPPFSVKLLRFRSGERYASVVDGRGLLTTQPNIYGLLALRERAKSVAMSEKRLRAVCLALNWAADNKIDLQSRVETFGFLSVFELSRLKDALRVNLRTGVAADGKAVVSPAHFVDRCHSVRDYIVWHAETSMQRIRIGDHRLPEARLALDRFVRAMDTSLPSGISARSDGIDESALEVMLAAIEPGHASNPFRAEHQHRNYALLLLYYETGMRRGEALKLQGEDLVLHGDSTSVSVIRRPDDPRDPRGSEPRVKTRGRPIPITKKLARALSDWISKHRSDPTRYPGAKRTPYVFVSRSGKPLGLRTVNDMYDLLRKRVPDLPKELTTHANRHAANVRFSEMADELGWSDAEMEQARNHHFGWSPTSQQGARYNKRHTIKKSAQYVSELQRKSLESK